MHHLAWRCAFGAVLLGLAVSACGSSDVTEVGVYEPPGGEAPGERGSEVDAGSVPPPSGSVGEFDWPEASPQQGTCAAGQYIGAFSCEIGVGGAFPSGPISGPLAFVLEEAVVREFLEITSGQLRGFAGLIEFTSSLQGELDCTTNEFNAISVQGQYPGGTFSGTLEGRLDRSTQTLAGTWSLAAAGISPCVGEWNVVRTP